MIIEREQLKKILQRVSEERLTVLTDSLNETFARFEINTPLRAAHFLGQVLHESGGFNYAAEIWGPTPAQVRYDTREDLGNTPEVDGDGKKYMGRGYIQVTGKENYKYASEFFQMDFVSNPDLLSKLPWAMLAAGWFWQKHKLNQLADKDNSAAITDKIITQITKIINGGNIGLAKRVLWVLKCKQVFKI